jgi:hypothetical protein
MNTEHKALELVSSFITETIGMPTLSNKQAKQCAIIAVDEIEEFMRMDDEYNEDCHMANTHWVIYWQEVKEHIQNLK